MAGERGRKLLEVRAAVRKAEAHGEHHVLVAGAGPAAVRQDGDALEARLTLHAVAPYPPPPGEEVPEAAPLDAARVVLPAPIVRAAWLRSGLAGPPGSFTAELERAVAHLLSPEGEEATRAIAGVMLEPAAQLVAAHAAAGADLVRLVVHALDPAAADLPWEAVAESGPAAFRSAAVVRRISRPAGERTGPYDLPITVATAFPGLEGTLDEDGWTAALFDEFGRYGRSAGALEWGRLAAGVKPGEVQHVVVDSSRAPDTWEVLGRLVVSAGAPRLLVVHDLSPRPTALALAPVALRHVGEGADAALIVSAGGADPTARGFFPVFYRKLLHDEPLDVCAARAREAAGVPVCLAAREGGELRLRLAAAVADAAARVRSQAARLGGPPSAAVGRAGIERGGLERGGLERGGVGRADLEQYLGGGGRGGGGVAGAGAKGGGAKDGGAGPGGVERGGLEGGGLGRGGLEGARPAIDLERPEAPGSASAAPQVGSEQAQPEGGPGQAQPQVGREQGQPEGGPGQPPPQAGAVPPSPAPPPRHAARAARASSELARGVKEMLAGSPGRIARAMAGVPRGPLQAEGHELRAMVMARREVAEEHEAICMAGRALDALAAAGAAPVDAADEPEVRLTTVWITRPDEGDRAVAPDEPLRLGAVHALRVQITPRLVADALVQAALDETALRPLLERLGRVPIDVVVFAPAGAVEVEGGGVGRLTLPRRGPSDEAVFRVTPRRAGPLQLRICLYHANALLQSVAVRTWASDAAGAAAGATAAATAPAAAGATAGATAPAGTGRVLDWVASADLALLHELPRPRVSLFTNDDPWGNHWVGYFTEAGRTGAQVKAADMRALPPDALEERAGRIREALKDVLAFPGWGAAPGDAAATRALRERGIVDLARAGYRAFDKLLPDPQRAPEAHAALLAALAEPGIVSVARCVGTAKSVPWAALYDYPLHGTRPLALCPVFAAQLDARQDLLDRPAECRAQAACPLASPQTEETTVCPFGFWGFRHQLEQPIQQITPTPVDGAALPRELREARSYTVTPFLATGPERPRLAFLAWPALANPAHRTALRELGFEVAFEDQRDPVLGIVRGGGRHVLYFFCHGDWDEAAREFYLLVGPSDPEGRIGTADLPPTKVRWPRDPAPLVFMNGCNTVATLPERTNDLLTRLRTLGAAGAVGTEIEVEPWLAEAVAQRVLAAMMAGRSIGEAFLDMRRALLRDRNPLGLAYAAFAPATLHLHPAGGACRWCARNRLPADAPPG